ncbi:hypothetical protein AXG93_2789s1100 [Marchantia polymorpha subsp. ruderalis]|uniref:Uncharacterized protein n=1 Tax=Marchantia polymorpha subsp. ruderalis TaxID=1480154 RepID=A0A176W7Z2_MARPO|nr:hypothetical protein AXG93_2789s1100 [Marchantia polymorpha subsp. ruderalis]
MLSRWPSFADRVGGDDVAQRMNRQLAEANDVAGCCDRQVQVVVGIRYLAGSVSTDRLLIMKICDLREVGMNLADAAHSESVIRFLFADVVQS